MSICLWFVVYVDIFIRNRFYLGFIEKVFLNIFNTQYGITISTPLEKLLQMYNLRKGDENHTHGILFVASFVNIFTAYILSYFIPCNICNMDKNKRATVLTHFEKREQFNKSSYSWHYFPWVSLILILKWWKNSLSVVSVTF